MSEDCERWLPLLQPQMPSPQDLMPLLERMYTSQHFSNFGPLARALEAQFADNFGVPVHQITTVSNATQGIELVLQALGLPPQSRILLPAFSFVATATAVIRSGHIPVMADVDAQSWLLTPEIAAQACVQTRIDAVLPVATFGMPHAMQAWQAFEQQTGLPVVIDAAGAYGSQWLEGAQGTLIFSLHATKNLPAGEGGFVASSRPGVAQKVRQLANFGINLDPASSVPVGSLAGIGSNAKMSEYHAAVALASLSRWEAAAERRRSLLAEYRQALDYASAGQLRWQIPGVAGAIQAPTLLPVVLPNAASCYLLEKICKQQKITTRRWYCPLLTEMQAIYTVGVCLPHPNAKVIAASLLGLPFFPNMSDIEVKKVVEAVRAALN